jgi:glutaredoxin
MGVIKLFVKKSCHRCPQAKQVGNILKEEGFEVIEYDIETADGLAEASFYSVQSTPTFILEDHEENAVADFRGEVPTPEKIREIMAGI